MNEDSEIIIEDKKEIDEDRKILKKSSAGSFYRYVNEVHKFPMLTPEEEYEYSMKFVETGDPELAKKLIQSHLRLVVKMAGKYKNYGLPMPDLVAEGNLGLIHAVKKFDPEKGFRLSTYAMWWIRAYIQEYILRSWSMVKMGTTLAQKKLFFNLHRIKRRIGAVSSDRTVDGSYNAALTQDQVKLIADDLNVSEKDVITMDSRLTQGDSSLNKMVGDDEGDGKEMLDLMASQDPSQEDIIADEQELQQRQSLFQKAFEKLNDREKDILTRRQMVEKSMTLEDLSQIYKVSRERIRQIEENAIRKIRKSIQEEIEGK